MTAQNSLFRHSVLTLGVFLLIGATGCSSSKKKEGEDTGVPTAVAADENTAGDSDSGRAAGLQTVHFPYDSSALDSESKNILKSNAQILKDKASLKIQIEGHTDQRGGIQYNIALGEKRANAVRKYRQDLSVNGDRISVISSGKEKPIDPGTGEESYAKNRRANFVITSR